MVGIYKITSPSGKVYIGQSIDIEKRFKTYELLNCKKQPKLYNSFLKYNIENHCFEILLECAAEELNKYERDYQDKYDVLSKNGLNCKLTQDSDRSGIISDELRLKLSVSQKGRKHSEETKVKIGLKSKGHKRGLGSKHSEETKIKMRFKSKGRKHTEESKLKLSTAHKGKKHTEESKLKMSIAGKGKSQSKDWIEKRTGLKKKIIMDILTGVFYIGIDDACKYIDIKKTTLTSKLNGTNKNNTNLIYV